MRRFNEFNVQRQLLAILGSLPVFAWISSSAIYPMTQHFRPSTPLEERDGYSIAALSPCITAEIAMQAASHNEALLRGKEQLNGYVEGGNSRLKEVGTVEPVTVKKLTRSEVPDQDPLILLTDRFNKDPKQRLYLIAYTLSSGYSRSLLGKPNNPYIKLREKDRELVARRTFWGYPTPNKVKKEKKEMQRLLERDGYACDDITIAEYSPYWVFYFLRRNEVIVPLRKQSHQPPQQL